MRFLFEIRLRSTKKAKFLLGKLGLFQIYVLSL